MSTSAALLVLALVVGAGAAPWGGNTPRCSTECPVAGSPKLFYQPEHTYTYTYSGKSHIHLKGVEGGVTGTDWSSRVELSWITPCDMVIFIKDSKVDGATGQPTAKFLEKYPLVVALTDGRVQHVCTHPEDDVWSINIKKGIASAFQNSLPSNSTINSGQNITETDVVGKCPTHYEVEREGDKVIVKKEKNHRLCKKRYPTPAETQMPWLKGPLPLEESECRCKQEITNGIYSSIICHDKKVVRPSYGAYKYVEAKQESTLRYVSLSSQQPPAIPQGSLVRKSLRYSYHTLNKDPSMVAELDQTMTQICEKTKDVVERDAAALVAKAVQLLRRVPEEAVKQTLDKIRARRYCQDHSKLESLFLDAVSFIHESGAVKVMVDELVNGRATVGRAALYTAAFYLQPRPCIHAMMALKPMFESSQPLPRATLAAASMVNTYCRHNHHCYEEAPVKSLVEALGNKLQRQCSPSADERTQKAALATLKALGNMGVMTQEVARFVMTCVDTEGVKINVRVAAAQAFRQVKCERHQTEHLVNIAVHPAKNTEVRIASYLMAMRCVQQKDLQMIVNNTYHEENTQVRGFILSHLLNLQDTNTPHKDYLRYLLTNTLLPRDYKTDFRKYSRNIDMSYFAPSLGVGAGVESNIIYVPGSFVPRSVDFNFTAAFEGISMNIGEVGARLEGLEPVIEEVFGPEGYLQRTSFSQILTDMTTFVEQKGNKILEKLQQDLRQKRSIDLSTLTNFLGKLYSDQSRVTRADVFARFMGQEITFASLAGDLKHISADEMIESFFSYFDDILPQMKNLHINSARTAQINFDYTFPTIQGIPLKLQLNGTAVAGLKMQGNLNLIDILFNWRNGENLFKIIPSLSVQVDGFVGYDSYNSKLGLEMRNTISSSNGVSIMVKPKNANELELHLDVPVKMDLIDVKSQIYMMKQIRGQPRTEISPPSSEGGSVRYQSCNTILESLLGLKFCYDFNFPNLIRTSSLPLSEPVVAKLFVEKTEPSMKGYLMTANIQGERNKKIIKIKVETSGSSSPREAQVILSYTKQEESYQLSADIKSSSINSDISTTIVNRQGHKGVEVYAKFKSSQTEISRGIKMDYKTISTSNEQKYGIEVYVSRSKEFSSQSQVIEAKFAKKVNHPEISLDVLLKTMNALRNYLNMHFEVGTDLTYTQYSRLPLPTKLRKFEFQSGMKDWQVTSFIRQTKESGEMSVYSSVFNIKRSTQDMIVAEAKHNIEGTFGQNLVVETAVTVKMGSAEYKAASNIHCERNKKGISMQMVRSGDATKVIELKAISDYSGQSYNVKMMLEMPEWIRTIKFESRVVEQGQDSYMVEAALKHGESVILHVQGPLTLRLTSQVVQLQTDMKITTMTSQQLKLTSMFFFGENKQMLSIVVSTQEPIFILEWNMKSGSSQGTVIGVRFLLPALIDNKVDAIIQERLGHVSFNTQLLPKSSSARRIKGFTDIDLQNKKWTADFSWDADNDQNKKISLDTTMISSPSNPGRASIHGNVKYMAQMYHVKLDVDAENLMHSRSGDNKFNFEVTTPSQNTIDLNIITNFESRSTKVNTNFLYKNQQNNKAYKLISAIDLEKLGSPYSYKLNSELSYTSPQGQQTTLHAEAKHQITPEERELHYKATVTSPALTKPLQVEMSTVNKENSYSVKAMAQEDMFIWHLETVPQGGVKTLQMSVDVKSIRDFMKTVRMLVGVNSGEQIVMLTEQRERTEYGIHYHKPTPTTYTMRVEYPTRTIEGEATYSPTEASVKVYPNKRESNAKYELTGKSSHTYWDQKSKFEGHISHPSLTRDIRVEVQYSVTGENMRGTIELDIFPDTADKITGTLQSTLVANNTVRVETSLTSKMLKVSPKFIMVTAYAPHTVGFDLKFQKSPSSPVSFQMSAKYDRVTDKDATAAFRVVTEEGTMVDIAGVMERKEERGCQGVKIKGVAQTSLLGSYHIYSRICRPAFIELITSKHGSQMEYITKFGLQDPYNIELSMSEGDRDQLQRRAIAMARVLLASPTIIDVDLAYKPEKVAEVQNDVNEKYQRVMQSLDRWVNSIYQYLQQQAQQQGSHFPNPEILKLMNEAKLDLQQIYDGVIYGQVMPWCKALCEVLWGPTVTHIIQVVSEILSQVYRVQRDLQTRIVQETEAWNEQFRGLTNLLIEFVAQTSHWMESGEMPQPVRRLMEQLEQTRIFRMIMMEMDAMREQYQEEYEAIKQVVAKVKHTLQQDIRKNFERITRIPVVQQNIKWIIQEFSQENMVVKKMGRYLSKKIQGAIWGVAIETKEQEILLQIPLYRPVYSLTQVLQEMKLTPVYLLEKLAMVYDSFLPIPVNNLMWAYYSMMPRQLTDMLPPYNRTAMVVGDTEILTFDGAVLRVPSSPCKVVLAAYASNKLTMAHPQPSAPPQITLSTRATTVTIKPDFRVDVGGQEMSSSQQTQGDVTIQKTPREVNMTSPFITVRVFREERVISVNVSGWTFGRLAGLLGTYDGEVGNDWLMPSGIRAPSLQELVSSWQEDQHCQTPAISPVNPANISLQKKVQCHALLGVRSRCYPLVHPEPFIKMCYGARQPWDAAQGYRAICSRKGVELMMPLVN
ncbi:vitellogenin-like [Homarus americanus]|uniref:vitellogenin-like n=1 Tax=Homarus americanus TaxID=6706 RepID=UPI001C4695B7|nr:vitellogenin-like [Homarus americanus]